MTIVRPPDSPPDPTRPPAPRHPALTLLGCLVVALPTGLVTTWPTAAAVFLASVALFKR